MAVCSAVALAVAPVAHAAFPGRNGDIVFAGSVQRYGFFVGTPGADGIYVVDPVTAEQRPLKVAPDGTIGSQTFGAPAWSPDGSQIAYYHGADRNALKVMKADGTGSRVLTHGDVFAPAWAPDGSMLAVAGLNALWLLDADGRKRRLLVERGREPEWSPDCSEVAFSRSTRRDDGIWTITATGHERRLAEGSSPEWSPDGRKIVFWRYSGPDVEPTLYVINADGTGEQRVGTGGDPAWSPDGSQIVFTNELGAISVADHDGSGVRVLTAGWPAAWNDEADWQPLSSTSPEPGLCEAWRTAGVALPRLRLAVSPKRARVGRLTRFRLRVDALVDGRCTPISAATVRFAGRRASTDSDGRAVISHRFLRAGSRRAIAARRGFRRDAATVRVVGERG